MTYIHHTELAKLRAAGRAPQGGMLPDDLSAALIDSKIPKALTDKLELVDQLFKAAAKYPHDPLIRGRVEDLVGRRVASAELYYPDSQQIIREEISNRK